MKDHSVQAYIGREVERQKAAVRKACANLRARYGIADNDPDMAALAGACRALEEIVTYVTRAK